jgi:hypothetical protein
VHAKDIPNPNLGGEDRRLAETEWVPFEIEADYSQLDTATYPWLTEAIYATDVFIQHAFKSMKVKNLTEGQKLTVPSDFNTCDAGSRSATVPDKWKTGGAGFNHMGIIFTAEANEDNGVGAYAYSCGFASWDN